MARLRIRICQYEECENCRQLQAREIAEEKEFQQKYGKYLRNYFLKWWAITGLGGVGIIFLEIYLLKLYEEVLFKGWLHSLLTMIVGLAFGVFALMSVFTLIASDIQDRKKFKLRSEFFKE